MSRFAVEWFKRGTRNYCLRPSTWHVNVNGSTKIMVALKGHFVLETRAQAHRVTGPAAVIVPRGLIHRLRLSSDGVEILNLAFRGAAAPWQHLLPTGRAVRVLPLRSADVALLEALQGRAHSELLLRDPLSREALPALVHAWLAVLLRIAPPGARDATDPRLARARGLLRSRFSEALRIRDVAREIGMSEPHFRERYRRAFGLSPKRDLDAFRLQRAQDLLLESDAKLREVARRCGFGNEQEFARQFRRKAGVTPGQWRKQG